MTAYQSTGKDWVLRNEVSAALRALREENIPMSLGTNQTVVNVERAFSDHVLGPFFPPSMVFVSEACNIWKPHLAFVETIAERMGLPVADLVYVGNSPSKDAPLVEAGCQVILIDHDGRYRRCLREPAFQERFRVPLAERRLVLTGSIAHVGQLILEAWRRRDV